MAGRKDKFLEGVEVKRLQDSVPAVLHDEIKEHIKTVSQPYLRPLIKEGKK